VIIDFIRHIHPANDKNLHFHLNNLILILVITGYQKEGFVGLPPKVIPRYLNGTSIIFDFTFTQVNPKT